MKTIINYSVSTRSSFVRNIIQKLSPILLFFLLLLVTLNVQGQDTFPNSSFGIRAGGNANSWTNEFPSFEYEGIPVYPDDWKATFGFHLGAYVNIRLSSLIALEPALIYTAKGTGTILNTETNTFEGTVVSNYIDFPFILRLYVSEGFNLFLGPQIAYHLNSKFDIEVDNNPLIQGEEITDDISELDFAVVLGLGYELKSGLNFNVSGELGFLSVDGYDILNTYNRTIRLSIGYSF